jgi:nitrous oxidase accessory protein
MRLHPLIISKWFWPSQQIVLWGSVLVLGCAPAVRAEILQVGTNLPFQSVVAALDSANPGDTIQIFPGVYPGNIKLDKTVTLEGFEKPILRGSGKASVVEVLAPACVIRGVVVEHSGGDLQNEDSGILLKSNENQVENNELRDILFGIYLFQSSGNHIVQNRIQGRPELETGERGAGIHIWNSASNFIEGNSITGARDGMYIQNSPRNRIRKNRVSNVRYGLHFMYSDENIFEDNLFTHNVAGAAIMYSNAVEFRRNAFTHNRGFSSFGILFQGCEENLAEGNFIIDNATGLFLEAVRHTTFRKNVIAENDVAMQIFSSSEDNLFSENQFVENLSPLQIVGRRTASSWQNGGRGNFWSDYDGYDLDDDGIGDVPHKIQNVFEYLEGNYPRLRLYLNSPAAQALALAEKTFPVITGSAEIDPVPLMRAMEFHLPIETRQALGSAHLTLAALSVTMLVTGVITLGKGRRR